MHYFSICGGGKERGRGRGRGEGGAAAADRRLCGPMRGLRRKEREIEAWEFTYLLSFHFSRCQRRKDGKKGKSDCALKSHF